MFELVGQYSVPIGCGDKVHYLSGDRFSTIQDPSGTHADDPVDAAVFHIQGDIPDILRSVALSLDRLDLTPKSAQPEFCAAIGYRASKGKRHGTSWHSHQDIFVSTEVEAEDYETLGIDPQRFVAIAYGTEILVSERWQPSPNPRGMSGGAIVRLGGLPANPFAAQSSTTAPVLSAIVTELRKENNSSSCDRGAYRSSLGTDSAVPAERTHWLRLLATDVQLTARSVTVGWF